MFRITEGTTELTAHKHNNQSITVDGESYTISDIQVNQDAGTNYDLFQFLFIDQDADLSNISHDTLTRMQHAVLEKIANGGLDVHHFLGILRVLHSYDISVVELDDEMQSAIYDSMNEFMDSIFLYQPSEIFHGFMGIMSDDSIRTLNPRLTDAFCTLINNKVSCEMVIYMSDSSHKIEDDIQQKVVWAISNGISRMNVAGINKYNLIGSGKNLLQINGKYFAILNGSIDELKMVVSDITSKQISCFKNMRTNDTYYLKNTAPSPQNKQRTSQSETTYQLIKVDKTQKIATSDDKVVVDDNNNMFKKSIDGLTLLIKHKAFPSIFMCGENEVYELKNDDNFIRLDANTAETKDSFDEFDDISLGDDIPLDDTPYVPTENLINDSRGNQFAIIDGALYLKLMVDGSSYYLSKSGNDIVIKGDYPYPDLQTSKQLIKHGEQQEIEIHIVYDKENSTKINCIIEVNEDGKYIAHASTPENKNIFQCGSSVYIYNVFSNMANFSKLWPIEEHDTIYYSITKNNIPEYKMDGDGNVVKNYLTIDQAMAYTTPLINRIMHNDIDMLMNNNTNWLMMLNNDNTSTIDKIGKILDKIQLNKCDQESLNVLHSTIDPLFEIVIKLCCSMYVTEIERIFNIINLDYFSNETIKHGYYRLCEQGYKLETYPILANIVKYSEHKGQERGLDFPIQSLRKYSKNFSSLKKSGKIGPENPAGNVQMLSELLSMRDITANQYFVEIVFLLFVACSVKPTRDGFESWLGTMVDLINQSRPDEPLDLNDVLSRCHLDTSKVILRTRNHEVFVRFTDNLFLKITNCKRSSLSLSSSDKEALTKCLSENGLQEYYPLIQNLCDNQIDLVNENILMKFVVNKDFQRICNISNDEIGGAVFTIAGVKPDFVGDVADRFNQGSTILVSMLPRDTLLFNVAEIENRFTQVREKSGYYCGTAISPETSPLNLFGQNHFTNQDVNKVIFGLIYLDDVINEFGETQQAILNKSGAVGDVYSNGRDLPVTQFRNGDTGFKRGGLYVGTARDKSHKNGGVSRPSYEIPAAVDRHMIKTDLYPRGDLPYEINQVSSEINFIPTTKRYVDSVFGLIVDARNKVSLDVEISVDVTKFDNWGNIIRASQALDKPIYILHQTPSGKLRLTKYEDISIEPETKDSYTT